MPTLFRPSLDPLGDVEIASLTNQLSSTLGSCSSRTTAYTGFTAGCTCRSFTNTFINLTTNGSSLPRSQATPSTLLMATHNPCPIICSRSSSPCIGYSTWGCSLLSTSGASSSVPLCFIFVNTPSDYLSIPVSRFMTLTCSSLLDPVLRNTSIRLHITRCTTSTSPATTDRFVFSFYLLLAASLVFTYANKHLSSTSLHRIAYSISPGQIVQAGHIVHRRLISIPSWKYSLSTKPVLPRQVRQRKLSSLRARRVDELSCCEGELWLFFFSLFLSFSVALHYEGTHHLLLGRAASIGAWPHYV